MPGAQGLRSDIPRRFFNLEERRRLEAAIAAAERRTSGEIRLHLERDVPRRGAAGGDPYGRARELFARLGMHRTAERNGVLIYLATRSHCFAVVGDEELHRHVGEEFWRGVAGLLSARFAAGDFVDGLTEGISLIGERLRAHFPRADDDINELPDELSFSG